MVRSMAWHVFNERHQEGRRDLSAKKRGPDGAVKHNRHHYTQKAHVSSEVFVATTNIDPPLEEANASTSDGLVRQGL